LHSQDPFFPDVARCRLNAAGIRKRTVAEFEREERALFESALTRATMLAVLSWPEFDARGESLLKSLYVEELLEPAADSESVRPAPRAPVKMRVPGPIADAALLPILREKTATISPTGLESFLQCPFQYFASKVLRLHEPPPRPEDRLTFLVQGNIVHETLAEWWTHPQDIGVIFERVFARTMEDRKVPFGYHSERLRNAMLDDLRRFAAENAWDRGSFQSRTEQEFKLPLDDVIILGKIDRLDTAPDGQAYVIDYKYGNTQRVKAKLKNENLLQAPLYLLAAQECFHVRPAGMFYLGLKSEIVYVGWSSTGLLNSEPLPENWLPTTRDRALRLVEGIRQGRVEAAPADLSICVYCDYRDACRVEAAQPFSAPEGTVA
jgi:ATP-dependent helicase/DNAse subunit B